MEEPVVQVLSRSSQDEVVKAGSPQTAEDIYKNPLTSSNPTKPELATPIVTSSIHAFNSEEISVPSQLERQSTKVESKFTADGDEDVVKKYLESLYKSAAESSWRSFVVDKSQAIVFSTTISSVVSFLWFVSLFGMLEWSVNQERIIGITTFCASFSFSSVINCYILPGSSLTCPPNFRGPTCVSWYDEAFPYDTTLITAVQILGILGTVVSFVTTVACFYILTRIVDQSLFRKAMHVLTGLMILGSLVSLTHFTVYLNASYIWDVQNGKGCVLVPRDEGNICEPSKNIDPPLKQGYAFTATVVIFVFSMIAAIFSAMGTMKEHYDLDKDD